MFDTLSDNQKKALARVGLGIMGISYGGRIRTNEPDIYALFVDFFYVDSQEEIIPILQDIIRMDQSEATEIAIHIWLMPPEMMAEDFLLSRRSCKTLDLIRVTLTKWTHKKNGRVIRYIHKLFK